MKKNIIKKLFILVARKLGLEFIEQSNLKFINENIIDINDLINTVHDKVTIEIKDKSDFSQLKDLLKESGKTKVKIKVDNASKIYTFELKNPRKFNFKTFSAIKDKEFIKKIIF